MVHIHCDESKLEYFVRVPADGDVSAVIDRATEEFDEWLRDEL